MAFLLTSLTFFIIFLKHLSAHINDNHHRECLIHNQKYSYEYLQTENDHRSINPFEFINTYVSPIDQIKDFDNLKWSIKPADKINQTYHLINVNQNRLLCATYSIKDIVSLSLKLRLSIVALKDNDSSGLRSCEWKFEQIKGDRLNKFKILSVRFNKALYAVSSSFFFKKQNDKRNVNLGIYKKKSMSNEYDWIINCSL